MKDKRTKFDYLEGFKLLATNPKKFFQKLHQSINILVPMIIIAIVMGVLAYISIDKQAYVNETLKFYENLDRTAPSLAQIDQAYIARVASFVYGPLLELLVKAALVAGLATMAGGVGSVKTAYSIALYSYMPMLIGKILVVIATGDIEASLSLAGMMTGFEGDFIYYFLAQIDPFVILYQILMIIGIVEIFDVDKKRGTFAVLCPWILWIGIKAGFQNMNYHYGTDILI
ncbi:MAG: YIP1 family protein [Tissierellales bacterium]|jgi:hypothetical protein|nr:YIP1 family protein [Tissierellales bacterium]